MRQPCAARSAAGLAALVEYMRTLAERKRVEPGDDVITELVAAAGADPELTIDGITFLAAGLLFAGHETTVTAIDRGVVLLLANPDQAGALRADPALLEAAVEEILRFGLTATATRPSEPVRGLPRYANTDFALGGVTIRTGDLVILALRAANLDEKRFPEPERFDVTRARNPHLTFGHGPRFCLGAPLARIELQVLFPALRTRFPTLRLAVPVEELPERDELLTGGLAELAVTW